MNKRIRVLAPFARSAAPFFLIAGLLIVMLTAYNWTYDIKPRLIEEATSSMRVLAGAKAETAGLLLKNANTDNGKNNLKRVLNEWLLLKDTDSGQVVYRGISLELDTTHPYYNLDLEQSLGNISCGDCIVLEYPLYSPNHSELSALITFYTDPFFQRKLIDDIAKRLAFLLLSAILILGLSWIATTRLIKSLINNENRLKEARIEAIRANKAKSTFLATMSHEIRTPLSGIMGYLELLTSRTKLDDTQKNYIDTIHQSAKSLLAIIQDILDISKIEADKLSLSISDVDFPSLIEQRIQPLSVQLEDKPIDLIINVKHDFPRRLIGDPVRLGQILTNIVGNAVKFTEEGYISVSLGSEGEDDQGRTNIVLQIEDSGIGIAEAGLEKLFHPFSQLDSGKTRQHGGTGLGLVIVKRLINLMEGDISVSSVPGRGTTFTIHIPLKKTEDPVSAISTDHFEGIKIICATGNRLMQAALKEMLPLAELNWVRSAPEARQLPWNYLSDTRLLLLDDSLNISALEILCEQVEKYLGLQNIQIVIIEKPYQQLTLGTLIDLPDVKILKKPIFRKQLYSVFSKKSLKPSASVPTNPKQNTANGIRILLAEDDEVNRNFMSEIINDLGYYYETAENGVEAVNKFEYGNFDLILMDIHMPLMDGLEAARSIRKSARGEEIPIIAITADNMKTNIDDIKQEQIDDWIIKPVLAEDITRTVNQFVTGHGK